MIIKCSRCGLEYSYGRNICHICKNNSIFFGALFKGDRQEYQWNCITNVKNFTSDRKLFNHELNTQDADLIMQEIHPHKWNCDPTLQVYKISSPEMKLSYELIYE